VRIVEGVSGVWKEFKKFISRGNVIDLAVGIIIGGAFQVIVKSLVEDIIMPIVSLFLGGIDFANLQTYSSVSPEEATQLSQKQKKQVPQL